MRHQHQDSQVIDLLDTCIRCAQELVGVVSERHRTGEVSADGLKCLTDALACLCRCQDYFKPDGNY